MIFKENCPNCAFIIEGSVKGFFTKKLFIPDFCGNCGTKLFSTCPSCSNSLLHLQKFCPVCGFQLYSLQNEVLDTKSKSNDLQTSSIDKKQFEMLEIIKKDVNDLLIFYPAMLRFMVCMNPVNVKIHNFNGFFEEINNNLSNQDIVSHIANAINIADLSNSVGELEAHYNTIFEITYDLINELPQNLITTMPDYKQWMPDIVDCQILANHLSNNIFLAMQKNRGQLELLQEMYRQLVEYFPKYQTIMLRSGVLDTAIGFAAGFLGGDLGVVGVDLWENWRGKSDSEFLNLFGNAIDQFSNIGLDFTTTMMIEVEPHLIQMTSDIASFYDIMIQYFEKFINLNWDIEPYFQRHRTCESNLDEDAKQFFELVFQNLREQGMTSTSEMNIKRMLGF